eukprot:714430-Pyramimonas_sp.AAC.1
MDTSWVPGYPAASCAAPCANQTQDAWVYSHNGPIRHSTWSRAPGIPGYLRRRDGYDEPNPAPPFTVLYSTVPARSDENGRSHSVTHGRLSVMFGHIWSHILSLAGALRRPRGAGAAPPRRRDGRSRSHLVAHLVS